MKKKIDIFLEDEELLYIAERLKEMQSNGFNTSRSEWIRSAVVEKMKREKDESK